MTRANDIRLRAVSVAAILAVALVACRTVPIRPAGPGQDAVVVLKHWNQMNRLFYLYSVTYLLDDTQVLKRIDEGGNLDWDRNFQVFNEYVAHGSHKVAVKLDFAGRDLQDGFKFHVESDYTFDAAPGQVTTVQVVYYDRDPRAEPEPGHNVTRHRPPPANQIREPCVRYELTRADDDDLFKNLDAPSSDAGVVP